MLTLRSRFLVAVVSVALASIACGPADPPSVTVSGDQNGLTLDVSLRRTGDSLRADTVVRNTRDTPIHLDTTQCGRVSEVILSRTVFQPEGKTYAGSLGAVKGLLLHQQRSSQFSDLFAPRRDGRGSDVPDCVRPTAPVTIPPRGSIAESWELPFASAYALSEVGSDHAVIRSSAVESVAADKLGFLDIVAPGDADAIRAGRVAVAETPASVVLDRPPTRPRAGASAGEQFDRMIETASVRDFIEAQPADAWRDARIRLEPSGGSTFHAVTTAYERAMSASLGPDGTVVGEPRLPTATDEARAFDRRPSTLPPGIAVIPEPETPVLTEDVIPGRLSLPSGRVVADGALIGPATSLPDVATPGLHDVFVTVGRLPGVKDDQVAFASLVASDAPIVSWVRRSAIAVDGGYAGFISAEGSEHLDALGGGADAALDEAFDSLTAHDDIVTQVPVGDGLDVAVFTTGYGDGRYDVYVGLDANGKPARYVIDFAIVHLVWPTP
ncbi:MAG: DUF4241 domain-containing protein [Chloroflexota bacterium]